MVVSRYLASIILLTAIACSDDPGPTEDIDVPAVEDALLAEIETEGISNRFAIAGFLPDGYIDITQRYTLSQPSGTSFQQQVFEFEGDQSVFGFYAPLVLRFDGEVQYRDGYVFVSEGDKNNRLTFALVDDGFVYLRGRGKVIFPDGKSKRFK